MSDIIINDTDLQGLENKVVLMTGGSSGIGMATVTMLLKLGAKVVNGDLNPPIEAPDSASLYRFIKTDVTSWADLKNLFKETLNSYGRIDHVFANAGTRPTASYLELSVDENGEPQEPSRLTIDVNLYGVINTASLALHYMQKQEGNHSIVLTASSSCFSRFRAADYGLSKHGVLGLLRGLQPSTLPIRVNAVAPSWTVTNLTEARHYEDTGAVTQSADYPAKAAIMLMADESRHGQMILSVGEQFREIEEAVMLPAMNSKVRGQPKEEDEICAAVLANFLRQ